jgi:hypothetical protein
MQKDAKCTESYPSVDSFIAGSINASRPHDYVWNSELPAIFDEEFVLLDLCEAIGLSTELRMRFYWARLVEQPVMGLSCVGIN